MNDPLTEARFWAQVTTDAERTIVCSPANADRVRELLTKAGLDRMHKVLVNRFLPSDGEIYVIDHHSFEAARRELFARPFRWRP